MKKETNLPLCWSCLFACFLACFVTRFSIKLEHLLVVGVHYGKQEAERDKKAYRFTCLIVGFHFVVGQTHTNATLMHCFGLETLGFSLASLNWIITRETIVSLILFVDLMANGIFCTSSDRSTTNIKSKSKDNSKCNNNNNNNDTNRRTLFQGS